jgi:hypothetical protein
MHALVVYESIFGNTRSIAQAVAEGLAVHGEVELCDVGTTPAVISGEVDLLVVGGPTHAHGMTTADTRADGARRAGDRLVSHGLGIREWLQELPEASAASPAAAFDTRIHGPGILWGSAAKGMAKVLEGAGFRMVVPPESFLVGGPTGTPFDRLLEGEVDRARAWGAALGERLARQVTKPQAVAG